MAKTVNRRINVYINDKQVENNMDSIRRAYFKTSKTVNKLTKDSAEYNKEVAKLRRLGAVMDDHRNKVRGVSKQWEAFKAVFLGTFGANLAQGIFQRAVSFIPELITGAAKVEDSLADIMKTTGMTAEEAKQLNAEFKKIDTRTARKEMRAMAVVAGQMGTAKKDVFDFVEAIDKINVALGDEFGDAGLVADVIGRLRNVFIDFKSDNVGRDLLNIGNAINYLSSAGMATAPVISDFANRIGGVGIPLGLTTGQVLGMSAGLQELSVKTEKGGTAVVKVMQLMGRKTKEFARIAKMDVKDFEELVNNDMFGALLKVAEEVKNSGEQATEFSKILEELQLTGSGASEVIAKIGENTDFLRAKSLEATIALGQQNSILNEFNIKNQTLGAVLDKLRKDMNSLFTSTAVQDFAKTSVFSLTQVVTWLKENSEWILRVIKHVRNLGLAWLAYKGIKAAVNSQMVVAIREGIKYRNELVKRAKSLKGLSAAQVRAATTARALSRTFKSLKGALVSTGIGALVVILGELAMALDRVSEASKLLKEIDDGYASLLNKSNTELKKKTDQIDELHAKTINSINDQDRLNILLKEYNALTGANINQTDDLAKMVNQLNKSKQLYVDLLAKENDANQASRSVDYIDDSIAKIDELTAKLQEKGAEIGVNSVLGPRSFDDIKNQFKELAGSIGFGDTIEAQIQKLQAKKQGLEKELKTALDDLRSKEGAKIDAKVNFDKNNLVRELSNIEQILEQKMAKLKKSYRDAIEGLFLDMENKRIQAQRNLENDPLEFLQLDLKLLEHKYDDLALLNKQAQQDAIKVAEQNMTAALAVLKTELDQKKIGDQEYFRLKKKVEDDFNVWKTGQDKLFAFAELEFKKAQLEEEKLLRIRAKQELMAELERLELNDTVNTTEIQRIKKYYKAQEDEILRLRSKLINLADGDKDLIDAIENEIEQELENNFKQERRDRVATRVDELQGYVNQSMEVLNYFYAWQDNKDQHRLRAFRSRINTELLINENAFKSKTKSEEEYLATKQRLERRMADEEAKIKRRAWVREQRAAFLQAVINGALGVTKAFATVPFPGSLIVAGLTAAATAYQAASILNTPVPEFERGTEFSDKVLEGPSHKSKEKGLHIVDPRTGKLVALAEGGEVLLSKKTKQRYPTLVNALLQSSKSDRPMSILESNVRSIRPTPINYASATNAVQRASANSNAAQQVNAIPVASESQNDLQTALTLRSIREGINELVAMKRAAKDKPLTAVVTNQQIKDADRELEEAAALAAISPRT